MLAAATGTTTQIEHLRLRIAQMGADPVQAVADAADRDLEARLQREREVQDEFDWDVDTDVEPSRADDEPELRA